MPALRADDIAHDRADGRDHDVVFDLLQPTDRSDDKRGIVGGDLGKTRSSSGTSQPSTNGVIAGSAEP